MSKPLYLSVSHAFCFAVQDAILHSQWICNSSDLNKQSIVSYKPQLSTPAIKVPHNLYLELLLWPRSVSTVIRVPKSEILLKPPTVSEYLHSLPSVRDANDLTQVLEARLEQANLLKKVAYPSSNASNSVNGSRLSMPSKTSCKTATSIATTQGSPSKPWTTPMSPSSP